MRKFVACRQVLGDQECTVVISAETDEELLEASVQHAAGVHGREDSAELRDIVRGEMTDEQALGWGTRPVY